MEKLCFKCNKYKPIEKFSKFGKICQDCRKLYVKEYMIKWKELNKDKFIKWREQNKDKINGYNEKYKQQREKEREKIIEKENSKNISQLVKELEVPLENIKQRVEYKKSLLIKTKRMDNL